jgi:DNA invertase Pin-like site-specific DNA recombinase
MVNELMLSILSGLAENESASIAQNNKWSIQRRFQNGTYKITCPPYGYDSVDGMLVVNKSQAKTVRFIFSEILSAREPRK